MADLLTARETMYAQELTVEQARKALDDFLGEAWEFRDEISDENLLVTRFNEIADAIAKAAVHNKAGARGLRAILENAMLDIMYDVPYREGVKECKITDGVILNHEPPLLSFEKEKKLA